MALGNFSQEDSMMSEINVTPLVDVMLVLLVVFIITAPLLTPQVLKIALPRTPTTQHSESLQNLRLTVDAHGAIALGDATLNDAGLTDFLQKHAAEPAFQLQIEADAAVPYGRVAELMAIAQKAGVHKLSFVTLPAK